MTICEQFSKYVKAEIFTDDKRGDYVCPVVDDVFMERAALKIGVTKIGLINDLRGLFWHYRYYNFDVDTIITLVAIQLYAVSICESRGEHSESAYRPRLEEILRIDRLDIDKWMKIYQDDIWHIFYIWCKTQGFKVLECTPKPNTKGRYVQYPITLARFSFNKEDQKSFGWIFKSYSLLQNEHISYADFWGHHLFSIYDFYNEAHTKRVIDNIKRELSNDSVAKQQIYNYFSIWNGEYKVPNEYFAKKSDEANIHCEIHLMRSDAVFYYHILDKKNKYISLDVDSVLNLKRYYRYRKDRNNIILFQKNEDYDNYWDETMFVRSKEESAIIITTSRCNERFIHRSNVLYSEGDVTIYEISYNDTTHRFYTQAKPIYELLGGLKIAKNTYLKGGEPILKLHRKIGYWLDGVYCENDAQELILNLDIGEHWVKFPYSRKETIIIAQEDVRQNEWKIDSCQWGISKKEQCWRPFRDVEGVVGLDFKSYSKSIYRRADLKDWVMIQNGAKVKSNNISVKMNGDYEEF